MLAEAEDDPIATLWTTVDKLIDNGMSSNAIHELVRQVVMFKAQFAHPKKILISTAGENAKPFALTSRFKTWGDYICTDQGEYDIPTRQRAALDMAAFGQTMSAEYPEAFRVILLSKVHKQAESIRYQAYTSKFKEAQKRVDNLQALKTKVLALPSSCFGDKELKHLPCQYDIKAFDPYRYHKQSILQEIHTELNRLEGEVRISPYLLSEYGYGHIYPFLFHNSSSTRRSDSQHTSFEQAIAQYGLLTAWGYQSIERFSDLCLLTRLAEAFPGKQHDVFTCAPIEATAQQMEEAYKTLGMMFACGTGVWLKIVDIEHHAATLGDVSIEEDWTLQCECVHVNGVKVRRW